MSTASADGIPKAARNIPDLLVYCLDVVLVFSSFVQIINACFIIIYNSTNVFSRTPLSAVARFQQKLSNIVPSKVVAKHQGYLKSWSFFCFWK
jgi:hypothetical protein